MAEKKITKRERFEYAKEVVLAHPELFTKYPDMAEFIDHEIELLDRKSSKSATETPAQKDAVLIADIVKTILTECTDENGMTVGAILKDARIASFKCHDNKDVSSQKITAVLTKNLSAEVENAVIKKVSYYRLKTAEVGE